MSAIFASAASAANAPRMSPAASNTFVTKAVQGGMAEVELGNLAQQNAANEQVKEFGRRMVKDHTKAMTS